MKFFAVLPFVASALAANTFVIKAWSTSSVGQSFKDTKIFKVDSHPQVFSVGGTEGNELFLHWGDKGSLVDQSGRGIYVDPTNGDLGNVPPFGRTPATTGFSVAGDHLVLNGEDKWRACPSGPGKFSLTKGNCVGGSPIVLQVVKL